MAFAFTDSARSALAPPLATKPPCEIVRNPDGSLDVVTNNDGFRDKWAFVDVGYMIGQMLILAREHKLQNPREILIPLIKKHIKNRNGEAEILLEGYDIDGIEEVRHGEEITGFILPVKRNGALAYKLIYNLQGGETSIPMKSGASVHVRVESAEPSEEAIRIAVALGSFGHGTNEATNVSGAIQKVLSLIYVAYYGVKTNNRMIGDIYRESHDKNNPSRKVREIVLSAIEAIQKNNFQTDNIMRWKPDIEELYKWLGRIIVSLERWQKETLNCSGEEKAKVGALLEVTQDAQQKLRDRLLLMEGKTDDKIFSLNQLFSEILGNIIYPYGKFRPNTIQVNNPEALVFLKGNKISIMSLLCNIADNAIRYGDNDNIKVVIDAKVVGGQAVITISDNGIGISQERIQRMWKPFQTTGGTGIGLTEARLIVKDHGGTISVQSEIGKGATFIIRLPLAQQRDGVMSPQPPISIDSARAAAFSEETLAGVRKYIERYLIKTPLIDLPIISNKVGKRVVIKYEGVQNGLSFKTRGVTYEVFKAIQRVITEEPELLKGGLKIVTQTDGNHGGAMIRAVAFAIQKFTVDYPGLADYIKNIEPVVFAFDKTEKIKKGAMEKGMAEYRALIGDKNGTKGFIDVNHADYDDALKARKEYCARFGKRAIYMEHGEIEIMQGHASAGLEIAEQLEAMGIAGDKKVCVIIPVGAGGPIGVAAGLKACRPNVTAIMVQTPRYGAFVKSYKDGRMHHNDKDAPPHTIKIMADWTPTPLIYEDGIAVDGPESQEALELARYFFNDAWLADPDRAINKAAPLLLTDLDPYCRNKYLVDGVVGGTTAITAEALLANKSDKAIRNADVIVLFGTEGNVNPAISEHIRGLMRKTGDGPKGAIPDTTAAQPPADDTPPLQLIGKGPGASADPAAEKIAIERINAILSSDDMRKEDNYERDNAIRELSELILKVYEKEHLVKIQKTLNEISGSYKCIGARIDSVFLDELLSALIEGRNDFYRRFIDRIRKTFETITSEECINRLSPLPYPEYSKIQMREGQGVILENGFADRNSVESILNAINVFLGGELYIYAFPLDLEQLNDRPRSLILTHDLEHGEHNVMVKVGPTKELWHSYLTHRLLEHTGVNSNGGYAEEGIIKDVDSELQSLGLLEARESSRARQQLLIISRADSHASTVSHIVPRFFFLHTHWNGLGCSPADRVYDANTLNWQEKFMDAFKKRFGTGQTGDGPKGATPGSVATPAFAASQSAAQSEIILDELRNYLGSNRADKINLAGLASAIREAQKETGIGATGNVEGFVTKLKQIIKDENIKIALKEEDYEKFAFMGMGGIGPKGNTSESITADDGTEFKLNYSRIGGNGHHISLSYKDLELGYVEFEVRNSGSSKEGYMNTRLLSYSPFGFQTSWANHAIAALDTLPPDSIEKYDEIAYSNGAIKYGPLGTALLRLAMEIAYEEGASTFIADGVSMNYAKSFYERNRFQKDGEDGSRWIYHFGRGYPGRVGISRKPFNAATLARLINAHCHDIDPEHLSKSLDASRDVSYFDRPNTAHQKICGKEIIYNGYYEFGENAVIKLNAKDFLHTRIYSSIGTVYYVALSRDPAKTSTPDLFLTILPRNPQGIDMGGVDIVQTSDWFMKNINADIFVASFVEFLKTGSKSRPAAGRTAVPETSRHPTRPEDPLGLGGPTHYLVGPSSATQSTAGQRQWVTGLLNLEQCKEAYLKFLDRRESINKWRMWASLSALSPKEQEVFSKWAGMIKDKFVEDGEWFAQRQIDIGRAAKYMPASELWESIVTFDKGFSLPYRDDKELKLWRDVLMYANNNNLYAHGTANFFVREGVDLASVSHHLQYHWALLNIMIEGNITGGDVGALDTDFNNRFHATYYGPFYVVFNRLADDKRPFALGSKNHSIYLVPTEEAVVFLEKGLEEAVRLGLATKENANEALSKIMTYQQFVDNHKRIKDIIAGRVRPVDIVGSERIKAEDGPKGAAPENVATPTREAVNLKTEAILDRFGIGINDFNGGTITGLKGRLATVEEQILWQMYHYKYPQASNRSFAESIPKELVENEIRTRGGRVRVLDLGCGASGKAINELGDAYPSKVDAHGIDISIENKSELSSAKLVEADIRKMPYEDSFFDVIYESFVLEYFPESDDFIKVMGEVMRVLKPGGVFIFIDTGNFGMENIKKALDKIGIGYEINSELYSAVIITKNPAVGTPPSQSISNGRDAPADSAAERNENGMSQNDTSLQPPQPVVSPKSERIYAVNFRDMVNFVQVTENGRTVGSAAKEDAPPDIIAVGKKWMKGYEGPGHMQFEALNPLVTSIAGYCEKRNIAFVIGDDDALPGLIAEKKKEKGLPADAKVVMLAGADRNGIVSDDIKALMNDKAYTIVGVDGSELTDDSYIRLMDMLTIALRLSIGIPPAVDDEHMSILPPNGRCPIYIIVPHAHPMKYEELKAIYETQRSA